MSGRHLHRPAPAGPARRAVAVALSVVAPEAKVAATVVFTVLVALTPRHAVPSLVADVVASALAVALVVDGVGAALRRLAPLVPVLMVAAALPLVAGGDQVEVAGLALSRPGLAGAGNLAAKATCGVLAAGVLATTTAPARIVGALVWLRVPAPMVAIAGFAIRYLDLLVDELARVRVAMLARGHRPRWLWQAGPLAGAAAGVFVRSFERGERVHAAMLARGFTGVPPRTDRPAPGAVDWVRVAPLPAVAAIGLVGGLVAGAVGPW